VGDESRKIAVILNPASAGGRTGRSWPKIEQALHESVDGFAVFRTEQRDHATALTRDALKDGFDHIVSVGGDGTHHEVVNGFFNDDAPINAAARMSILPAGTGSDLGRMLGLKSPMAGIPLINGGHVQAVDVGRVTFKQHDGSSGLRYFLNIADFGAGGATVERVNRGNRRLGPKLSYLIAVIQTVLTFRSPQVHITVDGQELDLKCMNCIVAKGQYYGGGIHVAPAARLDSGVFEVFVIKDLSAFTAIRNLPRFYNGSFVDMKDLVLRYQATHLTAQSDERVLIDLDGEAPGMLPLEIKLLPGALNLVVG